MILAAARISGVVLVAVAAPACAQPEPVNLPPRPALDELARWRRDTRDAVDDRVIRESSFRMMANTCGVHGDALLADVVRIEYGLVFFDLDYLHALNTRFPFAETVASGGCVVGPETHMRVRYCPSCREAKRLWMEHHPRIRELGDRDPWIP